MRTLLVALALFLATSSNYAFAWEKVHECDGSVIDWSHLRGNSIFQLVIRDQDAIRHLVKTGAVTGELVKNNEIIIQLVKNLQNRFEYVGPMWGSDRSIRTYYVKPWGNELRLEAFEHKIIDNGYTSETGPMVGEWIFRGCRSIRELP
jgi:hypothetical protein